MDINSIPIGAILAFSSQESPLGWLVCDGRGYLKEDFPALFEIIGTTFGGDGVHSFNVPDLQGQFIRGWDKWGNSDPERVFGTTQLDTFQGHSHQIDYSLIELESSGIDLYWKESPVRNKSVYSSHNHNQIIPIPFDKRDYKAVGKLESEYEAKECSTREGIHTHEIVIKGDRQLISPPIDSFYGPIKDRVGTETRPKNIALLFCIKAEDLPTAQDVENKLCYSTVIEKVKADVRQSVIPLYESLSLETIGSTQYTKNIELIKHSYFRNAPSDIRELKYLAAKCFHDICIYNCRTGQRTKEFDEYGLHLLVGWLVERGFIKSLEMHAVKEDIKALLTCMQSRWAPE